MSSLGVIHANELMEMGQLVVLGQFLSAVDMTRGGFSKQLIDFIWMEKIDLFHAALISCCSRDSFLN
jgi:hypothetical protein